MLLTLVLALIIQGVFVAADDTPEKRLLLHSDDDIATVVTSLKDELATLTQEVNSLKMAQQSDQGAVYTRWGRNTCPNEAELVYRGYVAGKHYNKHGSGTDNFCLPSDPTWGNYTDGFDGVKAAIYGTEMDVVNPQNIFPYSVLNHDLPCAVCKSTRRTSVMIPARTTCYPGWTLEYTGYLMTAMNELHHESYDTVCVDTRVEFVPNGGDSNDEHILYLVEAHCGSLPCPPYVNGRELACAVCSI